MAFLFGKHSPSTQSTHTKHTTHDAHDAHDTRRTQRHNTQQPRRIHTAMYTWHHRRTNERTNERNEHQSNKPTHTHTHTHTHTTTTRTHERTNARTHERTNERVPAQKRSFCSFVRSSRGNFRARFPPIDCPLYSALCVLPIHFLYSHSFSEGIYDFWYCTIKA